MPTKQRCPAYKKFNYELSICFCALVCHVLYHLFARIVSSKYMQAVSLSHGQGGTSQQSSIKGGQIGINSLICLEGKAMTPFLGSTLLF